MHCFNFINFMEKMRDEYASRPNVTYGIMYKQRFCNCSNRLNMGAKEGLCIAHRNIGMSTWRQRKKSKQLGLYLFQVYVITDLIFSVLREPTKFCQTEIVCLHHSVLFPWSNLLYSSEIFGFMFYVPLPHCEAGTVIYFCSS